MRYHPPPPPTLASSLRSWADDIHEGLLERRVVCHAKNAGISKYLSSQWSISFIEIYLVLPQDNECSAYSWLNESSRYHNYSTREYNSDSDLSGWYRFGGGAGIKMLSSCVPAWRCGTGATGWMSGIHPTVVDGKVTRKVFYNWYHCLNPSNEVEVVNCGQYYVYKLSPPPRSNSRYCGSDNWCELFHVHIMFLFILRTSG